MNDPGFEIAGGVVSHDECDQLLDRLNGVRHSGAGARRLMRDPHVRDFARKPGLVDLARRWLGADAVPFHATLFDKAGLRNWFVTWHQDATLPLESKIESAEWGPWSTKAGVLHARAPAWAMDRIVALRIHFDASTMDNGPLRVIPGSHKLGVLASERVLAVAHESPAADLLADRGGVIAMRPLLIHASARSESSRPRRVLHIEYADTLDLAPGLRLALS
ncbi:MAG TPA: phytanoyl-CoA dioxygenase family protein [Planctomycetota bacterium]|nr:phytanoyl-CoA dioxygenase family protein [Planctomycetota bacterium]